MKTDYCTKAPDIIFGLDLSDSCKEHDEEYRDREISRKEADIQFRENIKAKGGIGMFVIAWIYYIGVRLFGKSHYYWDE